MKASTTVSPKYYPALQRGLFWLALFFSLSALMLDFFYTNHLVIVAAAAHWISIMMILVRRPGTPTAVDLFICRAYPLFFGTAMALAPIIMGGFSGGSVYYRTLLNRWFGVDLLHDWEFADPLLLIPAVIWLLVYPFWPKAKAESRVESTKNGPAVIDR